MTPNTKSYILKTKISIHTALAGCDPETPPILKANNEFQSTQPSQAVTDAFSAFALGETISIHTALAGCDG